MVEYIVVTVFFSMLVYYALVGGDNPQCNGGGERCVAGGALSNNATEGTGFYTRYAFDPEGTRRQLHSYSGLAQSFRAKQDSFSQSIYQP